jgi:hypothetical protein
MSGHDDLPEELGKAAKVFIWVSPVFAFGFESVVMLWEGKFVLAAASFLIGLALTAILAR